MRRRHEAADQLQEQGLITYHRRHIYIADRPALLKSSCSCYPQGRAIYHHAMGNTG